MDDFKFIVKLTSNPQGIATEDPDEALLYYLKNN